MNTYKITFTRENGTTGSDNFTARAKRRPGGTSRRSTVTGTAPSPA